MSNDFGIEDDVPVSPEMADIMIQKIITNPNHDYWKGNQLTINFVNRLYEIKNGLETGLKGYQEKHNEQKLENARETLGIYSLDGQGTSSAYGQRSRDDEESPTTAMRYVPKFTEERIARTDDEINPY